jgi:hypothetical protein
VVSALRISPEEWEDERGKAIDFVPVVLVTLNCATKVGSRESNDAAIMETAWRII